MKAFVVSDNHDTLVGMRLAGISGCLVHTSGEAYAALNQALKMKDLGILAITEKAADLAPDLVQKLTERGELPLLVKIPDRYGSQREADFLTRHVQEAIGVKMG